MNLTTFKPYLLLTLLCLALYLPGMTTIPLIDRDSPHFAQATRQMVETGEWWKIRFQDSPRHLKPPGIYWLQAVAVKLFSADNITNAWPYRIPSLLGALLAVLLSFGFTQKVYGRKVALLSAALLASSLLLVIEAHLSVTDACLLATIVLMQGALWLIYQRVRAQQSIKWTLPALFWLGVALGLWIKGMTPIIALLTLLSLCICDRQWRWLKALRPWWGLLGVILLTCAWLIPFSLASQSNFLWDMIHGDLLPKIISGQESHGEPPGYFAVIFPLMFWPASLFAWQGFAWGWLQRHCSAERFLFVWLMSVWIIFELIPTKLPQYALPTYPAIAILMARGLYAAQQHGLQPIFQFLARIQYAIWTALALGIALAFCLIPYYLMGKFNGFAIFSAVIMVILIALVLHAIWRKQLIQAATIGIIINVIVLAPIFQWVMPNLTNLWVSERVVAALNQAEPQNINVHNPLLSVGYDEPSLVFLLGTHCVIMTSVQAVIQRLKLHPHTQILVEQVQQQQLQLLAKQNKLKLNLQGVVEGFNLGDGHWVRLYLFANS